MRLESRAPECRVPDRRGKKRRSKWRKEVKRPQTKMSEVLLLLVGVVWGRWRMERGVGWERETWEPKAVDVEVGREGEGGRPAMSSHVVVVAAVVWRLKEEGGSRVSCKCNVQFVPTVIGIG